MTIDFRTTLPSPRALTVPRPAIVPSRPAVSTMSVWRDRLGVDGTRLGDGTRVSDVEQHNTIAALAAVSAEAGHVPALAGVRTDVKAAKQAAPPRGVPR